MSTLMKIKPFPCSEPQFLKCRSSAGLVLLVCLLTGTALARPRPPLPPLPELAPLLLMIDFDEPYWRGIRDAALVDIDEGQLIESWSGYALVRSGAKLKPFVVPAVADGRANLATASGAVRLWFKPHWSSASLPNGTGPGAEAVIADMIVLDEQDALTAWSLRFSADGSAIVLTGEGGTVELLRAGVALRSGEWHCITLNYGPSAKCCQVHFPVQQ